MKSIVALVAASALLAGSSAYAQTQPQTFTITGSWGEVSHTGGMGPEGMAARAGNVDGTFQAVLSDGNVVNGTAHCVGMNQHPSQIFALVISCDTTSGDNSVSWLLGCNPANDIAEGSFACVGGIQGKAGISMGSRGSMTMFFDGQGGSHGVGEWLN
jgi:hypothetical protein